MKELEVFVTFILRLPGVWLVVWVSVEEFADDVVLEVVGFSVVELSLQVAEFTHHKESLPATSYVRPYQ